jgi:hypothetical protein
MRLYYATQATLPIKIPRETTEWKRIPRNAKATVVRLVRAAGRYRALEREYAALLTEISLADGGKKNA